MTVNVMVNSAKIKDIASVETYVQNYLGPLANDTENFQAAVTAIEFDTEQKKNAEAAQKAASGQAMNQQIISLLPIAALMIIGFMVVKTLSKAAKQLVPLSEPSPQKAMAGAGGLGFEMPALPGDPGYQPVERAHLEQIVALPPNEFAAALGALATSTPLCIDDIPDKVNIPLEQIKKMSIQKPDAVANLIKTWILEERK
jgi:flagellar biosynthesis/type III secretory pathway M-ring protein FliF/YscJ